MTTPPPQPAATPPKETAKSEETLASKGPKRVYKGFGFRVSKASSDRSASVEEKLSAAVARLDRDSDSMVTTEEQDRMQARRKEKSINKKLNQ